MKNYLLLILLLILVACSKKEGGKLEFKTKSYATIKINQEELLNDSITISVTHTSIIPDEYFKAQYVLNQHSNYLHIPVDRASKAQLHINDFSQNIWLSSNDTITINFSKTGEPQSFSGKFMKINKYFLAKKKDKGFLTISEPFNKILQNLSTYEEVKEAVDSLSKIEMNYLQNYPEELPDEFREIEEAQIVYNAAILKVQFPLFNKAMKVIKSPISEDYYDFVVDLDLNNPDALSINSYFDFLTNYFWKDVKHDKLKTLGGKERTAYLKNHLVDDANKYLSPAIKDYFLAHHLTDIIKFYDKAELDSITEKWQISINKELVTAIVDQKFLSSEVYEEGSKIDDFQMKNEKGEIIRISDFNDKIVYLNFWATWCKPCISNIPELNKVIKSYQENKNITFVNVAVRSDEEKWKESIRKFNLKGLNLFIPRGNNHERVRTKFGIKGIQHYVILGKKNILKVNYANKAPKVKTQIDALLKSNK